VFGFGVGNRTENCGPEQAALDDVEDVCVSVTLARRGMPSSGDDFITPHGGIRVALIAGPDGHPFLAEERTAAVTCAAPGPVLAREQDS
jgi:hypothetical protein